MDEKKWDEMKRERDKEREGKRKGEEERGKNGIVQQGYFTRSNDAFWVNHGDETDCHGMYMRKRDLAGVRNRATQYLLLLPITVF